MQGEATPTSYDKILGGCVPFTSLHLLSYQQVNITEVI